ncbi:MAG TPA: Flp pilus assembly protein CpaB [Polyangiaceae bacterium]
MTLAMSLTSTVTRRSLVAAGASTLLGIVLLQVHERRLVAEISGGEPVPVLTLLRDVPAGAVLEAEALGVRAIPEAYVERRAVREADLDKVVALKVALALRATESLLWTDLSAGRPETRELSALIQPGSRAVTVQAGTFDGLLGAGDRVDVVAKDSAVVPELLQNLLVVAVGGDTGRDAVAAAATGKRSSVTLTGSVEQAAAIAQAAESGEVTLSLRNPDDVAIATRPPERSPQRMLANKRGAEIEHVR